MNPEPSPAESSQAPTEPAAGTDLAATTAGDGTAISAPVALPDSAAEVSPAENVTNAPGLSPAACGARLAELFPALFTAPGAPGPARPIKLRIHTDIQARAPGIFSKRALGIFFSRYTTTNAYLKALTLAPHRFDLDGQAAGEISDEHRRLATEELARRHALAAERRAVQRPAPRRDATARDDGVAPSAQREPPPAQQPATRPGTRPGPRPDSRSATPPSQRTRDSVQRADRRSDGMPPSHRERPGRALQRGDPAPQGTRPQRPAPLPSLPEAQAPAALPVDPAQRERALLLRSFESSPLSKANFCALKGISEAVLDAALTQAQGERVVPAMAPASQRNRGR